MGAKRIAFLFGARSGRANHKYKPASLRMRWRPRERQRIFRTQQAQVSFRHTRAFRQQFVDPLKLRKAKRCLDIAQSVVVSEADVFEPASVRVASLIAQTPATLCD